MGRMGRRKLSTGEVILNKTILIIIAAVIGVLAILGYAVNLIIGAVFMALFIAMVGIVIDLPTIKAWVDENINDRKWE